MAAVRRVLVVGASAAGLRCACRLARLCPGDEIRVVERRARFSWAACGMPFVLGGELPDADALRATAWGALRDAHHFAADKGVAVHARTEVVAVDPRARRATLAGPAGQEVAAWDELVLATGARARTLGQAPGDPRVVRFHDPDDLERLASLLRDEEIRHVAVIGAGLVGCEVSEALAGAWGVEVTLLEAADRPLPAMLDPETAALVAAELERGGVRLRCDDPVRRIRRTADGIVVESETGAVTADLVIEALGVVPQAALAVSAGASLGPAGGVLVDERLATDVPGVHAVGDVVEVPHRVTGRPCHMPLGSLANRQGRTLANVLAGRDDRFGPVTGAVALRVFDLAVAAVGLTADAARREGLDVRSVCVSADDAAHYWPESARVHVAVVWEGGSRRLLGVQAAGRRDAKRIVDLASAVIAAGGTIDRLGAVEHAYCPPLAPAIDPLAVAAFCAQEVEAGRLEPVSPLAALDPATVLDVRVEAERRAHPLAAARARTPAEMRADADDLPDGLVVACERGPRASEAARLLAARGRRARWLAGGLAWRRAARETGR